MILKNLSAIEKTPVSMPGAEKCQMQILCGPADGCPNFAMRKFTVAPGGHTPKHQHDYEHEVLVLSGEGVALSNGVESPIKANDVLYVPANELHQFRNTGGIPLQFICLVPAFVHSGKDPVSLCCASATCSGPNCRDPVDCAK